jgi:ferredoxin
MMHIYCQVTGTRHDETARSKKAAFFCWGIDITGRLGYHLASGKKMEKIDFEKYVIEHTNTDPANFVSADCALRPELAGLRIFDKPIFGYAFADDPLFAKLKEPQAIGPHVLLPSEWLSGAKTVISVFFPFTEQIRASNRKNDGEPSDEWLHGRIEGQAFLQQLCAGTEAFLEKAAPSVCPLVDPRLHVDTERFMSNWSERHTAYIAGLGTFGLSKGLITKKGVAGRFVSFITTLNFAPLKRQYTGLYDYCVRCGGCVERCPATAITFENGKAHPPCGEFLKKVKSKHAPHYGCGKCQAGVPCESARPKPGAADR